MVSPAAPCPPAAARPSFGRPGTSRRQGEGRGSRAFGAGARCGHQGQRASGPERRRALRPGLGDQDRDRLAGDRGLRRGLPLPDPLLSGQGPSVVRTRGRRPLPDLRRIGSARAGAGDRGRQEATDRHRARRELLPRRSPHSGRRGHQSVLRCLELGARGELQHDQRSAPRQQGRSQPKSRPRSLRSRSKSTGRGGPTAAAA